MSIRCIGGACFSFTEETLIKLPSFPNLRELVIEGMRDSNEEDDDDDDDDQEEDERPTPKFTEFIKKFPNLRSLDIHGVNGLDVESLSSTLPKLTDLKMAFCSFSDREKSCEFLGSFADLKSLKLEKMFPLENKKIKNLKFLEPLHKSLIEFDMKSSDAILSEEDCYESIRKLQNLKILRLEGDNKFKTTVEGLESVLVSLPHLEELVLNGLVENGDEEACLKLANRKFPLLKKVEITSAKKVAGGGKRKVLS